MILQYVSVQQFRNYEYVEISTDAPVNILIGENAQGKTNLLEAMLCLSLTRSHRTHKDRELIRWNQEQAGLHAEVKRKYGVHKLDLHISKQGKKAKINGLEQKKLSHFIGKLNTVMFAPEDLEIVKGSPAIRRRFMDMEIGQVHPGYVHELSQYQKILNQRNNYLRQLEANGTVHDTMLEVWNQQLAEFGSKIMKKRQSFVQKLQKWATDIHLGITREQEQLQIHYQPSLELENFTDETVVFNQFMIKLSQVTQQEIKRGVTLIGPHRDDLHFFINGKEVQLYGSQGQQRTTALSLKLAEIELIHEEVGEYPILLLDDVLSELDHSRQTQLIETFQSKVQTFITTTSMDGVKMEKLNHAKLFYVENGKVKTGND